MPFRPASRQPRRLLLALVLAAVALAACDLAAVVGPRSWSLATTTSTGAAHAINVSDRSGKVTNVVFDPADADLFTPVTVPASQPNALDVTWTGGDCDLTTDVAIASAGAGLALTVRITPNGQACDAMGVPRVIRLTLAQPIPPAAVTVTQ